MYFKNWRFFKDFIFLLQFFKWFLLLTNWNNCKTKDTEFNCFYIYLENVLYNFSYQLEKLSKTEYFQAPHPTTLQSSSPMASRDSYKARHLPSLAVETPLRVSLWLLFMSWKVLNAVIQQKRLRRMQMLIYRYNFI